MAVSENEIVGFQEVKDSSIVVAPEAETAVEDRREGFSRHSSMMEISQFRESESEDVGTSSQRVLEYSKTAPVGFDAYVEHLIESHEVNYQRSKTEKKETPKHDLKLDRLSEREKRKMIENLVKIQNDGTVEVDVAHSASVASELLELDAIDLTPADIENTAVELNKSIPRLKIAMLVVGTRGDVQPFLAFAKRLQEFGHHVRLATHSNFCTFVKSAGIDFYPLGGDPRILAGYMARNKGFLPSGPAEISIQRKQLKAIIDSLLSACTEPDMDSGVSFKAQAIIANPPAYAFVSDCGLNNLVGHKGIHQRLQKKKLKLSPIAYFSTYHGSISHLPTGYMWSSHLVPKPRDWGSLVDVVGYCFLNLGMKYQPKEELVHWIQRGTKPIYIGFGSMPLEGAAKTTDIILEALRETGQRGIIDRGWGDLGNILEVPDNIFLLEDCPHDWLFPLCSAVVHHGGAGTTATGLRAGCPTAIIPFFGDQFFWGERIHQVGVGPAPIPISELTVEVLSNCIKFMLDPEVKLRAMELAKKIENEDGVAAAVNAFHRHLPTELPLPAPSSDESPNPFEWLFSFIEKWCCFPCTL
ncbi:Sterol 3-beta-glucosyltransferase UGT80B1 [Acorus calamus]|uniref:Sterol 3-beta-glucosyltransferase UGT80B1 n=1 Tax=Acorus calamus TaxID=4465 RepID=A0AAV9ECK3_ACOCL|nr:Sterol 3-beta-glucosyltransferase UGT80B1 [Acorus calamus]